MEHIRIFLLGNTSHPESLAAMAAEKHLIERQCSDVRAVDPSSFNSKPLSVEITVSSAREFKARVQDRKAREFAEDAHAMLTCDGVLVMDHMNKLDREGMFLYTIALRCGMRMSNSTGDLICELRRARNAGHLDWRPRHIEEFSVEVA